MAGYTKTDTLLSVENVSLSFKERNKEGEITEKKILSNINMSIKDIIGSECTGQVVSLVGKSGVGKSQLIRMLSGLHVSGANITGDVKIFKDKTDKQLHPVKEGDMGIVFQNYYMPEHLKIEKMLLKSAKKNVELKSEAEVKEAVEHYLSEFDLLQHKDKYPIQLSGGQKQRASIIMQILNGSYFLLMDEPFSGLDPLMIDKTTALLQKVANSDELKTIIIVSHDLLNCGAISDTIFILSDKGREKNTGATIVKEIDLLSMGLAYQPNIKKIPTFLDTIDDIKNYL